MDVQVIASPMTEERHEFRMLVGLPGVGKSTYAERFKGTHTVISPDDYIFQNAPFNQQSGMAQTYAISDMISSVWAGKSIVFDATNLTRLSRANKLLSVPGIKYRKVAVVFELPMDELKKRLASRPDKQIPQDAIDDMAKRFQPPTLEEGFDEIINMAVPRWSVK